MTSVEKLKTYLALVGQLESLPLPTTTNQRFQSGTRALCFNKVSSTAGETRPQGTVTMGTVAMAPPVLSRLDAGSHS